MPVEQMAWTNINGSTTSLKLHWIIASLIRFSKAHFQWISVFHIFPRKKNADQNSLKKHHHPLLFVWSPFWSSHLRHVTVRHHTNFWPSPKEPVAPWSIGAMEVQDQRWRDPHLPSEDGEFFLVGWFGKGVYFQLLTGKIYVECKL